MHHNGQQTTTTVEQIKTTGERDVHNGHNKIWRSIQSIKCPFKCAFPYHSLVQLTSNRCFCRSDQITFGALARHHRHQRALAKPPASAITLTSCKHLMQNLKEYLRRPNDLLLLHREKENAGHALLRPYSNNGIRKTSGEATGKR